MARELEAARRSIDKQLGNSEANAAEVEALRAALAKANLEVASARDQITQLEESTRQKESERQALAEQVKATDAELGPLKARLRELRVFEAALLVCQGEAKSVSSRP